MDKTAKAIVWAVVIVLVIWGLVKLIGGSSNQTAQNDTGPIKVGFIGPLTGNAVSLGVAARSAVELATEEINAAGGVNGRKIEMIYEDGQCNPKAAVNAANKLIGVDKVSAIVGGLCSSETSAFAPQAMQNKAIVMSYCSSAPPLSSTGKYFFRDYPSDAFQGKFAAQYAYNTLGAKKVAVIYHIGDWGTGVKTVFEAEFKNLGGQIVVDEGTLPEARDYRTQLTKVKAANPDYLYLPLYPEGGTALINQLKEFSIKTKVLGADAWGDPKLQKDVSGKADILYVGPKTLLSDEFKSKLLNKTGGDQVPVCAPQAYDALYVLTKAMSQVGLDPDKLQDAIRKTDYAGVSGKIQFDQNGDMTIADYVVKRIQGGTEVEVK